MPLPVPLEAPQENTKTQEITEEPTSTYNDKKSSNNLNKGFIDSSPSIKGKGRMSAQNLANIFDIEESEKERPMLFEKPDESPIACKPEAIAETLDISWNKYLPPIDRDTGMLKLPNSTIDQHKKKAKDFLKDLKAAGFKEFSTSRTKKKL